MASLQELAATAALQGLKQYLLTMKVDNETLGNYDTLYSNLKVISELSKSYTFRDAESVCDLTREVAKVMTTLHCSLDLFRNMYDKCMKLFRICKNNLAEEKKKKLTESDSVVVRIMLSLQSEDVLSHNFRAYTDCSTYTSWKFTWEEYDEEFAAFNKKYSSRYTDQQVLFAFFIQEAKLDLYRIGIMRSMGHHRHKAMLASFIVLDAFVRDGLEVPYDLFEVCNAKFCKRSSEFQTSPLFEGMRYCVSNRIPLVKYRKGRDLFIGEKVYLKECDFSRSVSYFWRKNIHREGTIEAVGKEEDWVDKEYTVKFVIAKNLLLQNDFVTYKTTRASLERRYDITDDHDLRCVGLRVHQSSELTGTTPFYARDKSVETLKKFPDPKKRTREGAEATGPPAKRKKQ